MLQKKLSSAKLTVSSSYRAEDDFITVTKEQRGYITAVNVGKCNKGNAIPLKALTGPEDCRRLRLPDFKTIGT
jgi:hypothetical protein